MLALLNAPRKDWEPPGRVTVELNFVAQTLPPGLMVFDHSLNRLVLRRDTELYTRGVMLGMPPAYLRWLAGEGPHGVNICPLSQQTIEDAKRVVQRGRESLF